MSFLGGRLAAKEGAYFLEESKHAVTRLRQTPQILSSKGDGVVGAPPPPPASVEQGREHSPDVLPEVLKHSVLSRVYSQPPDPSALPKSSKWDIRSDRKDDGSALRTSRDVVNPLRAYVALPQVTFGPKRWELPPGEHSVSASTVNELREDRYEPLTAAKLKDAAEGLAMIGKAFAVATIIVFGGASLILGLAAKKLEIHNIDDIRVKGRELMQRKFEMVREQVVPLKKQAENISQRLHVDRVEDPKQSPMIKELSKTLGSKAS